MEITNLALAYHLAELKKFVINSYFNKIQEVKKGILKFKLHTKEGGKNLVFTKEILYLTNYKLQAQQNVHGFAAFLKKQLYNKKIIGLVQHGFDRIVVFETEEFNLIFEFFGESNIILTDKEFMILSVFKIDRWKDRTLVKGEVYKFPSSRGLNPAKITDEELIEIFKLRKEELIKALIGGVNIAPIFAEEICFQLKLDKRKNSQELNEKEIKEINSKLKNFYEIDLKKLKPVVTDRDFVLPFPLESVKGKEVESLNHFFDETLSKNFLGHEVKKVSSALENKVKAMEFSLREQEDAKKNFEKKIDDNKKKAELIYEKFSELEQVLKAIEEGKRKGVPEKEIEKKIKEKAMFVKELNLKEKRMIVEFP